MTASLDWLLEQLPTILCDLSGRITAEATLASLGADTIDLVEIEIVAQDQLGIALPDGAFDTAVTVADVAAVIEAHRS